MPCFSFAVSEKALPPSTPSALNDSNGSAWTSLDGLAPNTLTMASNRVMIKRMVNARSGGKGAERLKALLDAPPPVPRDRAPTSDHARSLAYAAA